MMIEVLPFTILGDGIIGIVSSLSVMKSKYILECFGQGFDFHLLSVMQDGKHCMQPIFQF